MPSGGDNSGNQLTTQTKRFQGALLENTVTQCVVYLATREEPEDINFREPVTPKRHRNKVKIYNLQMIDGFNVYRTHI